MSFWTWKRGIYIFKTRKWKISAIKEKPFLPKETIERIEGCVEPQINSTFASVLPIKPK